MRVNPLVKLLIVVGYDGRDWIVFIDSPSLRRIIKLIVKLQDLKSKILIRSVNLII